MRENVAAAEDHNVVVQRFGRYPHRNKYLGRETTAEEMLYLVAETAPWAK